MGHCCQRVNAGGEGKHSTVAERCISIGVCKCWKMLRLLPLCPSGNSSTTLFWPNGNRISKSFVAPTQECVPCDLGTRPGPHFASPLTCFWASAGSVLRSFQYLD